MIKINFKLIAFLIILFCSILKANESYYWCSLGIGSSNYSFTGDYDTNLNLGIKLTYQFNKYLASISSKTILETWRGNAPSPLESVTNLCLILSRYLKNEKGLISSGIGPLYYFVYRRGKINQDNWPSTSNYEQIYSNHIGITANAQFFLYGPEMGLGFNFSYNYFDYSYFDFLVSIHFGKIGNKI